MKTILVLLAAFTAFVVNPVQGMEYRSGFSGGNCSTCAWIAADGKIDEGSAQQLIDFIKTNDLDYAKLIVINSTGGNLTAAVELGVLIRQRGMKIIVGNTSDYEPEGAGRIFQSYEGGVCASACVFVLMGGEVREVADEDSLVGVHQFAPQTDRLESVASTTSSTQSIVAILQSYTTEMGVDPAILVLASSTDADGMRWLNMQDMEQFNLVTSRNHIKMANWSLRPSGSYLVATATQEQTNGRKTAFIVGCGLLHIGFEMLSKDSDRMTEIAASLQGAELTLDNSLWAHSLAITDVSVEQNMVFVSFQTDPNILPIISQANDDLNINLDVEPFFMSEYWGWEFNIPTSNIDELTSHISKTCG